MSYDSIATTYDRFTVPHYFVRPAEGLVHMLELPQGSLALDVGTGTGVVVLLAEKVWGAESKVVGLDPSLQMLRIAQRKGIARLVAGKVPDLPFSDNTFQDVLASFVLSHFPRPETALSDMVRVLRPGGKLGVTAWVVRENVFDQVWKEIAASFISQDVVQDAMRQVIPGEAQFAEIAQLQEALQDARLEDVDVDQRSYPITMSIADHLAIKEAQMGARFMRRTLDEAQWEEFKQRVADEFQSRFKGSVDYTIRANFAVGTKVED